MPTNSKLSVFSVSVRESSLEVVLGFVRQGISREPARERDTSVPWKSTAAQIEALARIVSDRQFFFDLLRLRKAAAEEQCCAPGVFGRSGNTGQQHWTTGDRFSPYQWVNQSDKQKPPVILSPGPHPSECVVRTKMRIGGCAIEPFESPLLFGISTWHRSSKDK